MHDPPEFDRAAVIAYHNAMPQRIRDRMNMQSLARGLAAPAEATRPTLSQVRFIKGFTGGVLGGDGHAPDIITGRMDDTPTALR